MRPFFSFNSLPPIAREYIKQKNIPFMRIMKELQRYMKTEKLNELCHGNFGSYYPYSFTNMLYDTLSLDYKEINEFIRFTKILFNRSFFDIRIPFKKNKNKPKYDELGKMNFWHNNH